MGKQPASPESVAVLIENSKRGIYDSEKLLEKIEDTKTIFESISTIEGTALEFLQIVFELLSGCMRDLTGFKICYKLIVFTQSVIICK